MAHLVCLMNDISPNLSMYLSLSPEIKPIYGLDSTRLLLSF